MNREGVILHQGDFFKESEIIIDPHRLTKKKLIYPKLIKWRLYI